MITGKVVEIIDSRTLAINVGRDSNVQLGMIFLVLEKNGKQIIDPDTKEILGDIKLPKIKVKISHVDEKFSIAETFEYEETNVGSALTNFSTIFSPPKYIKRYKTFNIEEEQRAKIEEEKSIVKVGDLVEQIEK